MDATDILAAVDTVVTAAMADCATNGWYPSAMGLSCQRSSFLLVDSDTKAPASPVLTWQDRRAASMMDRFDQRTRYMLNVTGLPPSPHFGGPKLAWLIDNDPSIGAAIDDGTMEFVTLSALIVHHLTGNLWLDESIAGRTLCYNLTTRRWDEALCHLFGWGPRARPKVVPTHHDYGTVTRYGVKIPLKLSIGDQQAAMVALGARSEGETAINLGTSGSVLVHTGPKVAQIRGLLSSIAWSSDTSTTYIVEGTINAVGALFKWFADEEHRPELAESWLTEMADDTNLVMVPNINGLAAPYWLSDTETVWFPEGAHPLNERLHAGMTSIASLTTDIIQSMAMSDPTMAKGAIHCGGGMAQTVLLQAMSDHMGRPLHQHSAKEATARGVAQMVADQLGWSDFTTVDDDTHVEIAPIMGRGRRREVRAYWHEAVRRALGI